MSQKPLAPWLIEQLPAFQEADYLPQRFDDSTHELWRLEGVVIEDIIEGMGINDATTTNYINKKNCFLKVCTNTASPFWQIMQHLFKVEMPNDIDHFKHLYPLIESTTPLRIPTIVSAKSPFILALELEGTLIETANQSMVKQLARHLAGLHKNRYHHWGTLSPLYNNEAAKDNSKQWVNSLEQTIRKYAQQQNIPNVVLDEALLACQYAETTEFVLFMPDLRWDQFLQQDNKLYSLVDLDAFVLAPRELDFVLLEFILTEKQYAYFAKVYSETYPIPELKKVRPAYRLLLFLMQVLGEENIERWMSKAHYF